MSRCIGSGLSAEETSGISRGKSGIRGSRKLLQRGENLFREGDRFEMLYVVHSGAIKTQKTTLHGERQIIDFYLTGDIVGLDGIMDDVYTCEAEALDTSSICCIGYREFLSACRQHPALYRGLLQRISAQLRRDEDTVVSLGSRDANQRIARLLARLSDYFADNGFCAKEFCLPMSRTDIANHLGLALETVSRQLARLRDRGVIGINRNNVTVFDLKELKHIAGMATELRTQYAVH